MNFKTLFLIIGMLFIAYTVAAPTSRGIKFDAPTQKELQGHDLAQAHLYYDDTEVPPMYCTVKNKTIAIQGTPILSNQLSASSTIRLDWLDDKKAVIYRLTKTIPTNTLTTRHVTIPVTQEGWVNTPIKQPLIPLLKERSKLPQ